MACFDVRCLCSTRSQDSGDSLSGPHAVERKEVSDGDPKYIGKGDSHVGKVFERSCSVEHDMQEVASLSIMDYIMFNWDRVIYNQGYTGNIFSAGGPNEPFNFLYIDNAQQFIQALKYKGDQYLTAEPEMVSKVSWCIGSNQW